MYRRIVFIYVVHRWIRWTTASYDTTIFAIFFLGHSECTKVTETIPNYASSSRERTKLNRIWMHWISSLSEKYVFHIERDACTRRRHHRRDRAEENLSSMCGDPLAEQLRFRKARKSKKSFPSQQIYYYFIFRWLLFELHSRSRLESRLNDVSCEINYVQIEYGISRFVLFIFGISLFLQPNCFFEKHRATSNVRMCTVQHGTGK